MTEQTNESGAPLQHAYQVTHFVRPAGDYGGWSQVTSAEHTAEAALDWIRERVASVERRPLQDATTAGDGPEATSAADGQADAAEAASVAPGAADAAAGATS